MPATLRFAQSSRLTDAMPSDFRTPQATKPSSSFLGGDGSRCTMSGERRFTSSSPRDDVVDPDAYARVLERRLSELEESTTCVKGREARAAAAAAQARCAALEAENARLRVSTGKAALETKPKRAALMDVTNGASAMRTPIRTLKAKLDESAAARGVEAELRETIARMTRERVELEASISQRVERARETSRENEEWLANALRSKCEEVERVTSKTVALSKRVLELEDALGRSEKAHMQALERLDAYRGELKASVKAEKKHAKLMHEKYKTCKTQKSALVTEIETLKEQMEKLRVENEKQAEKHAEAALAFAPSRGSPSTAAIVGAAIRFASFVMENPRPLAAIGVALFHFFAFAVSFRMRRATTTMRVGDPLEFDVSGFTGARLF